MNLLRRPFPYRNDNLTLILIGLSLLTFLLQRVFPETVAVYAALNGFVFQKGWVWQFVTYLFVNGSAWGLIFNLIALFFFGSPVERELGSGEFLCYYLLTGVLSGVCSCLIYWVTGVSWFFLTGAAGSLFAVELAYASFFPDTTIYIWGILPLPAPVMVLIFAGIEVALMITGDLTGLTTLSGFVFGWLYLVVRLQENPWRSFTRR